MSKRISKKERQRLHRLREEYFANPFGSPVSHVLMYKERPYVGPIDTALMEEYKKVQERKNNGN